MAKGFKGIPGGMGNMGNLMAQAQKMQREIENVQSEIKLLRINGTSGGDKVKLVLGGDHKIYNLEIAPEVIDPEDSEMLADLITAAYNQANDELEATSAEMLNKVTGGVKMPF
ncbi:MAG: YbaB/EbfC family nucleoid-associated protein [Clostridiales bacterium]|nr:YbaB/EbfC family nucleoid-associated protein [Clostridiales bacterium]